MHRAGREEAGAEHRADDEAHSLLGAARKFAVQDLLIEQCVGQRDEEEVHVDQVEEARDHAEFVDAGAEPADPPGCPELRESSRAAVVQLDQQRRPCCVRFAPCRSA